MPKIPNRLSRTYVGIDPGKHGGIAVIKDDRVDLYKNPETPRDVWDLINGKIQETSSTGYWDGIVFYIEKVGGYKPGRKGQPGSSMFQFGRGYGLLLMALVAVGAIYGYKYEEVSPVKWMRGLGIPPRDKSLTDTEWKWVLRNKAQQLFPQAKLINATCDALLISEYARRKETGTL